MQGGSHTSLQALSPFSTWQSLLRPWLPPTTADPAARLDGGGACRADTLVGTQPCPTVFCLSSWWLCSDLSCLTFRAHLPVLKINLCLCSLVHMRCCHADVAHTRTAGSVIPRDAGLGCCCPTGPCPAELPTDSSRGLLLCSVCVSTSLNAGFPLNLSGSWLKCLCFLSALLWTRH